MGLAPGVNLSSLVLLDTAGLQTLIREILEQVRNQEDRLHFVEQQFADHVKVLKHMGEDTPGCHEALRNQICVLETRLRDIEGKVGQDLQACRDTTRQEVHQHQQVLEDRMKQAETYASECVREASVDREIVDEHSAMLIRIEQQLNDIGAEIGKHVEELQDASASARRMFEDNCRQNDLIEELERSLCSKASEAAVESLRRDMEHDHEVLREALKATGAKVAEQEKRVERSLNGFCGGPSSSLIPVSRQRSNSRKGSAGSSMEVSGPVHLTGAVDNDTAQRAAYISHTRSLSPPVLKLGSFKHSSPSTTAQSQGVLAIVKPRPTAPTIMATPWSQEPLALGIVGGRTGPSDKSATVPAIEVASTGADTSIGAKPTIGVDDTYVRRKEASPDVNAAPLLQALPNHTCAAPPAPRWASSQSGLSSRPSSSSRHRPNANRPLSASTVANSDGDGRPIGMYVSRSVPTLSRASGESGTAEARRHLPSTAAAGH